MNESWTFQSNLPSDVEFAAIRRKAAKLQAAHAKALFGRIAGLFGRGDGVPSGTAVSSPRS